MSILTGTGNPAGGAETTPPAGISAPQPTYEGDFVLDEHLLLDCGRTLANPTLHYAVYGGLNAARDNAVLVCHALSGSARVGDWWPEIFASDGLLHLESDCVLCVNLLGFVLRIDWPRLARSGIRKSLWAGFSSRLHSRQRAGAGPPA